MYRTNPDFVFTVTRDFVRGLPDADPGAAGRRPGASVRGRDGVRAPRTQCAVSLYPWKEPKELIPLAVRHVRTFLKANRPAR